MSLTNPFKKERQLKITDCTEVFCTLQVEGTHNWPDCPFPEVDYLKVPHRHVFHVKAFKRVLHDDRDVEFIMLKHEMVKYLNETYAKGSTCGDGTYVAPFHKFGAMSCEMIAKELCDVFMLTRCEVSEDNENGAIVTRDCTYE